MDFIFDLLGIGGGDGILNDIPEMIGGVIKWIVRCGCLLVLFLIGAIGLVILGVLEFGDNAITIMVVVLTMIVALASLIRTSLGY